MGIFSGYLMVSDLDGTFFGEDSTVIPERNIAAVREFIDNGGLFSLATGRGVYVVNLRASKIPRNAPDILFNGELLYDFQKGEMLFADGMTDEFCYEYYFHMLDKFPRSAAVILSGTKVFCPDTTPRFTTFLEHLSLENDYEVFDDIHDIPFPWFKILIGCPDAEYVAEMTRYASKIRTDTFSYVNSSPYLLEIASNRFDKGTGLKKLASMLDIDMSKTIAAGDYFNDEPMLDAAAYSFVPENGADEMKAKATAVLCHNTKGLIGDIVEWLKQELK